MRPPLDAGLPGLSTALEVDGFLDLLRGALPELQDRLQLLGGHILDVRYEPGGPCWLLYRLKVRSDRSRSRHQLLSAQLLRAGEEPSPAPAELLARFRARQADGLSTPTAYLPQAHMVVYAFPLDLSLPGLCDAIDPSFMRRQLNQLWAPRKVRVREVTARPLGYTPRARAAFLYDVLAESRENGLPELRRLIGKMHAKKTAARLFAGAWALWRAAGGKISLAPPVGYLPATGLTLQEQVRGERLGGLASAPEFVKWVRRTARMVAALHRLSLPLTTRRKPADEAEVVHRWAGVLAAVRPDLKARVEKLRDRLASELEARTEPAGPVHGDFHHTNVLVQDQGVVIIDLDEMAYGDPLLDVGRFLASLRIPALRACGSLSGLAGAGEAFLSEYLARAGGDEKRVRLFEAASLVTTAASSFRIQRASWDEEVALLLEESERVLERAGAASAVRRSEPPPPPRPVDDAGRWARDPVYMQAALDPFLRAAYGAEPTSCRVAARPKTGSGERIRYVLRGLQGREKWSVSLEGVPWRSKGRDFVRRLEALRSGVEGRGEVPLLPRPVAYLRSIALLIWEPPSGTRFSSLIGSSGALEAAARVARSLAALHRLTLELEGLRSLDQELQALRLKVGRLEKVRPDLLGRAASLLEKVEGLSRAAPARLSPTVGILHPHHVLLLGERVALSRVEQVGLSHPLLDVGDFLARLTLLGLHHDNLEQVAPVGDRFREAYCAAGAEGGAGVAGFEAAALLRLACAQAGRDGDGRAAEGLLERAAARVAP